MKVKFFTLTCLIIALTLSVHAQAPKAVSTLETFDLASLPSGWTVVDTLNDSYTWEFLTVYPVAYSLDGTPFAMVNSDAAGAVDMSEQLISPTYNLAANNLVIIEFDQYFRYFGAGGSEVGNVDVWDGSEWVNVYSVSSTTGDWAAPDHQYIDASAYKNANFKVRFHYKGAYDDYWWAIDNVKIWDPQPNDVGTPSLAGPGSGYGMGVEQISVVVKNFGTLAQTSIPVSYQVDGGSVVNETLNSSFAGFTSLAPGAEFTYTFTATYDFSAFQVYNVKTWTGLATDTDHDNDTMNSPVLNAPALVQEAFDPILNGTMGVESDGNYYWVSFYTTPGKFGKYSLSGTLIDTFRIAACTVGIRDLAWDPQSGHFFGGSGTPTIYELALDSVTPSLIASQSTFTTVRYIAYDHTRDGFWLGNVNGDIYLVDRSGVQMTVTGIANPILNSNLTGMGNRYGLAYDDWSCPGEYLWIFCQPGTPSNVFLAQVDVSTGLPTGRNLDLTTQIAFTGAVPAAGGLFTQPDIVSGTVSLGGLVTGAVTGTDPNMIFILELEGLHPDQPFVIDGVFPADGASQVHLDHMVMMWSDEPMVINNPSLIEITDGTTPLVIDSIRVYGDTLKIFHQDFQGDTQYTVNFGAGAVTGLCSDNTDYSWSFTTGTVGVGENSDQLISFYPNPAGSYFTVENASGATLKIYSITGSCVLEQQLDDNSATINVAGLNKGIYVTEITLNGNRQVRKLVISR